MPSISTSFQNASAAFDKGIEARRADINNSGMDDAAKAQANLSLDMLEMQQEMNMLNTMIETMSAISKSGTDLAKSIANKI